jgi:hypothetical protein
MCDWYRGAMTIWLAITGIILQRGCNIGGSRKENTEIIIY